MAVVDADLASLSDPNAGLGKRISGKRDDYASETAGTHPRPSIAREDNMGPDAASRRGLNARSRANCR
jgi:hypothetical protein